MSDTPKHTPGPWQVIVERHPRYTGGEHVERRIFTAWDHPQMKGPIPVVNTSIGIGAKRDGQNIFLTSISEADAALIASAPDMADRIATLERDVAAARALAESLQNKWASRPIDHPNGEALAAENDRLMAERDEAWKAHTDALQAWQKDRDALAEALRKIGQYMPKPRETRAQTATKMMVIALDALRDARAALGQREGT